MKQKEKIINVFIIYTALSISISILAWIMVTLGFVHVPEAITNQIGSFEIALAIIIYGLGIANVWTLSSTKKFYSELFLIYLSSQAFALFLAIIQQGWLFFPAVGSQGTIPALVISTGMFFFLWKKSKEESQVISS